jgi:hypothetical protein
MHAGRWSGTIGLFTGTRCNEVANVTRTSYQRQKFGLESNSGRYRHGADATVLLDAQVRKYQVHIMKMDNFGKIPPTM